MSGGIRTGRVTASQSIFKLAASNTVEPLIAHSYRNRNIDISPYGSSLRTQRFDRTSLTPA